MSKLNVFGVRVEALFASNVQTGTTLTRADADAAIRQTVKRLHVAGCCAHLAAEFGDYPETTAPRLRWAHATITTLYPKRKPCGCALQTHTLIGVAK